MSRARWGAPAALLALAVLLHAAKLLIVFRDLRAASPYPLVNVDYVQYYTGVVRSARLLSRSGRLWGYDPFEMGGTLTGPVDNADVHLFAPISWALSRAVSIARSLLVLELASFALAPLLFAAGVALYAGLAGGAAALLLSTMMYGLLEPVSSVSMRHGNWAFQLAAWLAPLTVALLDRWLRSRRAWAWAAATAMTAGLALLTPLSALVVGFPMAALLSWRARTLDGRQRALIAVSAALVLLACWPWLRPLLLFPGWRIAPAAYMASMGWAGVHDLFGPAGGWFRPVAVCLRLSILGLALGWVRRQSGGARLLFAAWLALLGGMALTGSSWPLVWSLSPARFAIPFWLLVYAAAGMRLADESLIETRRGTICAGIVAASLACETLAAVVPGSGILWPRLTNRLPPQQQALLDFFAARGPLKGRALIECLDDGLPHFSELFSVEQRRAVVGGPMPADQRPTRFTLFATSPANGNHPIFAGKSLETMPEADFAAYLKLYDVSTVVARSPAAQNALSRYRTLLARPARVEGAMVYDVRQPASWLLAGTARGVTFDYDRLTLEGASRGPIVLKFHWLKTLKVDPPMSLGPVYILDDPVPFIQLRNDRGASRITISG